MIDVRFRITQVPIVFRAYPHGINTVRLRLSQVKFFQALVTMC